MAFYAGKHWKKEELRAYLSDMASAAGAVPYVLTDGKASGVQAADVHTGSGFEFQVLMGRSMDINSCRYKGIPLQFSAAPGVTSPAYYEEPGFKWLRTFFGGLLSTCGITSSGAPSVDQGEEFGLHGRIGNAEAEQVSISQQWIDDEYIIELQGSMREASVMGENLVLKRKISTRLGSKSIRIDDVITNLGFEPQPLMMLYHFNFGYPLLSENAEIKAPIINTVPRDKQAESDNGVAECRKFSAPVKGYGEKVFFHTAAGDDDGNTFAAIVNPDVQGNPLGVVLRYNLQELPKLTQWKMMGKGCYVCGLEPGTVNPIGRSAAREKGELPFIEGQQEYHVGITVEVLDSQREIDEIVKAAAAAG